MEIFPQSTCTSALQVNVDTISNPQLFTMNDTVMWFQFVPNSASCRVSIYENPVDSVFYSEVFLYEGNCNNLIPIAHSTQIDSLYLNHQNFVENSSYFIKVVQPTQQTNSFYMNIYYPSQITLTCPITCPNLIQNPSFEIFDPLVFAPPADTNTHYMNPFFNNDVCGWHGAWGSPQIVGLNYPPAFSGSYYMKMWSRWFGENKYRGEGIYTEVSICQGNSYNLSFMYYQAEAPLSEIRIVLAKGNNISFTPSQFHNILPINPNYSQAIPPIYPASGSTSWTLLNINFEANNDYDWLVIYPYQTINSQSTLFIDQVHFERIIEDNEITICINADTNLTIPGCTGDIYSWSGPNNFSSNLQNPPLLNVTSLNAGVYTCTVTDINGCTYIAHTEVEVVDYPDAPIIDGPNISCIHDTEYHIVNYNSGYIYNWHFSDGNTIYSYDNVGHQVNFDWLHLFPNGGTIMVEVIIPNVNCTSVGYLEVHPCCNLDYIPQPDQVFYSSSANYDVSGYYYNEIIVINGDVVFDGDCIFEQCTLYLSPFSTLGLNHGTMSFASTLFTNCLDTVWKEIKILNAYEDVYFVGCTLQYSQSGITNDVGRELTVTESDFYNNYEHGLRLSNFITPSVNISGNLFTCTDPADMIFPYYNMRPEKGIYLKNNTLVAGAKLDIGTSNKFSEIFNGIYSINSDVHIHHNEFENIHFPPYFCTGVFASNPHNTTYSNNVKIEENNFDNCSNGIVVSRSVNPLIEFNSLSNTPSGVAIQVNSLKYYNVAMIIDNTISDYSTGIFAHRNDKALINIIDNQISWSQTWSNTSAGGNGIRIAGSLFPLEKYYLTENNIINPNLGINIIRVFEPLIIGNTIQNVRNFSLTDNLPTGIFATNCKVACIKLNTISGPNAPQSVTNLGIHFTTSPATDVIENTLFDLGSCIRASFVCPNSSVHRNSFENSFEGLSLAVNGFIGAQSGPNSPSDNYWLPNLNHWAWPTRRVHFCYASNGNASPLYVNPSNLYPPNLQNTTGVWTGFMYADALGDPFAVPQTTGQSTIDCGSSSTSTLTGFTIAEAIALINELVYFPEYEEDSYEWAKRQLFAMLSGDSLALTNPDIMMFLLQMETEPAGILMDVQLLLELGEYYEAGILNLSIQTLTLMEEIERIARNLQIRIFLTDTMTTGDIQQLQEIAFMCPFTHGEGVYIARSLLSVLDPNFEYFNECEFDPTFIPRAARIGNPKSALKVYPNPVQDVLNFELLNFESDQPVMVQVSDISGRTVLSTSVKVESSNSIHVGKLESGCYLLKVKTETDGSFTEKFCLIR